MANPYFWEFPKKSDTMYMSTIERSSSLTNRFSRDSTFLLKDIEGAYCKQQIPKNVSRQNYNNSTYIEPRPDFAKSIKKVSDPLKHDDIEGTRPQAVEFKTNRVVNPIAPRYKLPSSDPVDLEPPAKFLRNTLDISDIVKKKQAHRFIRSPKSEAIVGSSPTKHFRTIQAISRLSVKDINDDGKFVSARRQNPTDPLKPVYKWRDSTEQGMGLSFTKPTLQQEPKPINQLYGDIYGARPKKVIPQEVRKPSFMDAKDIQGAHANSYNQTRFFNDKRKEFRNYMNTKDIQKSHASSLKKGIQTRRSLNPLMPNYNYPS